MVTETALEAYFASAEFDPEVFTPADHAAAFGAWSWLGTVAARALATDQGGIVDDDLAYVAPGGYDPRLVPSLHATWLAQSCPTAELWLRPDDGHVSILNSRSATRDPGHQTMRASSPGSASIALNSCPLEPADGSSALPSSQFERTPFRLTRPNRAPSHRRIAA